MVPWLSGSSRRAAAPAFELNRLAAAEAALQANKVNLQNLDVALMLATKEEAVPQMELVSAKARRAEADQSCAAVTRIEGELGWWNLLGKALGNDGVIALCVDDAGPELASAYQRTAARLLWIPIHGVDPHPGRNGKKRAAGRV